jgi:hypothetical protein
MIIKRIASVLLWGLVGLLIVAPVATGTALALSCRLPAADIVRQIAAGVVAALGLAAFVLGFTRRRWRAFAGLALVFGATPLWRGTTEPPRTGDGADDVVRQTSGRVEGDIPTLSDLRDFDGRSMSNDTPRWSARSYDLTKLKTLAPYLD